MRPFAIEELLASSRTILTVHYVLGNVLQQRGMLDDAIVCFRRAVDLKPDHLESHHNLGVALQEQGLIDEAVVCF